MEPKESMEPASPGLQPAKTTPSRAKFGSKNVWDFKVPASKLVNPAEKISPPTRQVPMVTIREEDWALVKRCGMNEPV